MRKMILTKGKHAIIDNKDFKYLNQWKWSFDGLYAIRGHYLGKIDGKNKYKKIYMHREINQTPIGAETDHINKNKLDNRRSNLRTVTKSQNNRNRNAYKCNKTGISGVHWYNNLGKYRSSIVINGQRISLGYFLNINDAIVTRRKAEQDYYAI